MGDKHNGWNFVTAGTARDATPVEELFVELVATAMDELFSKLNAYLEQPEVSPRGCIDVFIGAIDRRASIRVAPGQTVEMISDGSTWWTL